MKSRARESQRKIWLGSRQVEEVADIFGGWHHILDESFQVREQVYAKFEAIGFSRYSFEAVRYQKAGKGRKLLLYHIAEALLLVWLNYLDGDYVTVPSERPVFKGKFVDLEMPWFWEQQKERMASFDIMKRDIEALISYCVIGIKSPCFEASQEDLEHQEKISELAAQCRPHLGGSGPSSDQPPEGPQGDGPQPAPVPLRPRPVIDETAVALPLPEPDEDEKNS